VIYKPTNDYVFDRVYDGIRRLALSGDLLPGARLHIDNLAGEFDVSSTPVREALNRLVAEDIIDMEPKAGFFTKHVSEVEIRDLLDINQLLLDWSLDPARERLGGYIPWPRFDVMTSAERSPEPPSAHHLAKVTGELFSHIARQSRNSKVAAYVAHVNDRLHYLRLREYEFIPDAGMELRRLCVLCHEGKFRALRDALRDDHVQQSRRLPQVLKQMVLYPKAGTMENHI
tara:strand:- start:4637 stop:5323 length:687 start_codon:yes stop_codon:yes gene_type:complete